MKVNKIITEEYVLSLTREESDWLRSLMQNPIECDDPDDEEIYNRDMRRVFWDALQ